MTEYESLVKTKDKVIRQAVVAAILIAAAELVFHYSGVTPQTMP